jgi:putative membrane protein
MIRVLVIALSALALAACGKADPAQPLQEAAMASQYQLQAAEVAEQKAKRKGVRKWAASMKKAYTNRLATLKETAEKEKISVQIPPTLDVDHQKLLAELKRASPDDFDKVYVKQQVDTHKRPADLLQKHEDVGNAAVKALIVRIAKSEQKLANSAGKLLTAIEAPPKPKTAPATPQASTQPAGEPAPPAREPI